MCMSSLLYLPCCSSFTFFVMLATLPKFCEVDKQASSSLNRWENRSMQDQQNCLVLQSLTVTKLNKNEEFWTFRDWFTPFSTMIAKQLLGKEQRQKTRSRLSFLSYIVLIPIVSIPKYLSMYPLQKTTWGVYWNYIIPDTTADLLNQNLRGRAHNISFIL